MTNLTSMLQGMKWYDTLQYSTMLLMSIMLPLSWRMALIAMILMAVAAIVKAIATHAFGNRSLSRGAWVAMSLMAAYWAIFCLSVLWSNNKATAWHVVELKLPFLLLPLIVGVADSSFLTHRRWRTLFAVMGFMLLLRLVFFSVRAVLRLSNGLPFGEVFDWHFDDMHHNYLALYLLVVLAYLYTELIRPRTQRVWQLPTWVLGAVALAFGAEIVIIGSRSGLVVLAVLFAVGLLHTIICRRQHKLGLLVLASMVVLVVITYLIQPMLYYRILATIGNLLSGNQAGDVRLLMDRCGWQLFLSSPWIGIGCGDVWQELQQVFVTQGFSEGLERNFDSHNQYLETLMATGLIGILIQIAMMAAPLVEAIRQRRNRLLVALITLVFVGCIFFEATFGRQMGSLFFIWWTLIALLSTQTSATTAPIKS
ncbi:MAG: O-antigen ligase family protein [Bacteroidales bacterium]|nr:O-antigen ligase family protein [Bacteroidales bacterium]